MSQVSLKCSSLTSLSCCLHVCLSYQAQASRHSPLKRQAGECTFWQLDPHSYYYYYYYYLPVDSLIILPLVLRPSRVVSMASDEFLCSFVFIFCSSLRAFVFLLPVYESWFEGWRLCVCVCVCARRRLHAVPEGKVAEADSLPVWPHVDGMIQGR